MHYKVYSLYCSIPNQIRSSFSWANLPTIVTLTAWLRSGLRYAPNLYTVNGACVERQACVTAYVNLSLSLKLHITHEQYEHYLAIITIFSSLLLSWKSHDCCN